MKNRMPKLMALLLCVVMVATLFAGCNNTPSSGGDEINYDIDLTQKPKLNVLMPNSGKDIKEVNSHVNAQLIQRFGYQPVDDAVGTAGAVVQRHICQGLGFLKYCGHG